jgi:hypothetical protein
MKVDLQAQYGFSSILQVTQQSPEAAGMSAMGEPGETGAGLLLSTGRLFAKIGDGETGRETINAFNLSAGRLFAKIGNGEVPD